MPTSHTTLTADSLNLRQTQLLQALAEQGGMRLEDLAARFNVTLQTIRRDAQLLASLGKLLRFHGGVRLATSTTENVAYAKRQAMFARAKSRIAQAAAALVPNGSSLMLNIGTTTEAVAQALLQHKGLRVITNNLNVASILSANPSFEVIVAPGVVRAADKGITGEATVAFVRQFKVDIGLIGISGIEPDGTLMDYDYQEVSVAKAILAQARATWLCADASKFERPAMVSVGHLRQVKKMLTDAPVPEPFAAMLHTHGIDVVVA